MDVAFQSQLINEISHQQDLNNADQNQSLIKLATAQRINEAAVDTADLAMGMMFDAELAALHAAELNAMDALSMLDTAGSTVEGAVELTMRAEELAIRANSSALTDAERGYIDAELQSIKGQLDDLSSTTFNDVAVFDSSLSFQLGDEMADVVAVDIAAIDAATLGMQNTSVDTMANASSALADIQAGRDSLIAQAGAIGDASAGIAMRADNIRNQSIQVATANSRIQDADMAALATDLSQTIVKQEAGAIAMSHAQANLSSFLMDTM